MSVEKLTSFADVVLYISFEHNVSDFMVCVCFVILTEPHAIQKKKGSD